MVDWVTSQNHVCFSFRFIIQKNNIVCNSLFVFPYFYWHQNFKKDSQTNKFLQQTT